MGAGPAIGSILQHVGNNPDYAVQILHHIYVGEADHGKSMMFELAIATRIVGEIMGVAVDFHDKSFGRTKKVADVGKYHVLAAKFVP